MNPAASSRYAPGNQLYFPYTNNYYVITAVDEDAQTVTFARACDLDDDITETIVDIESVNVRVLPDPKGSQQ